MRQILLTQGKYAIVDDEDYDKVRRYKWCFCKRYAIRWKKKDKRATCIYMHRIITGIQNIETGENKKGFVDHIDGDGLNNQKLNLRVCTHQQNRANSKVQTNNTSGYKCVMFDNDKHKRRKRWKVEIKVKGKKIYIGRFLTKEEAALAYNEAALKYYGQFARLNLI